jgi:hypothetical protein
MSDSQKITVTDADKAVFAFDAANGVEPFRTTAERIALSHGFLPVDAIVDDIAHAMENTFDIGQRRPQR